jgi:hypothetical protein
MESRSSRAYSQWLDLRALSVNWLFEISGTALPPLPMGSAAVHFGMHSQRVYAEERLEK